MEQCVDRAHRLGQTAEVVDIEYLAYGPFDDEMCSDTSALKSKTHEPAPLIPKPYPGERRCCARLTSNPYPNHTIRWFMVQNKQRVLDESGVGTAAAADAATAAPTDLAPTAPHLTGAPAAPSPPQRRTPLSYPSPPSVSAGIPQGRKRRFGDIHTPPPVVLMPVPVPHATEAEKAGGEIRQGSGHHKGSGHAWKAGGAASLAAAGTSADALVLTDSDEEIDRCVAAV